MIVLGISGKKRAGKNTLANYITGRMLKDHGSINDFTIDVNGKLVIQTHFLDGSLDWGVLDLDRRDYEFINSAEQTIWPFVKCYSFAEPLKDMVIEFFEVDRKSVYGNEDHRNAATHIKWENMPGDHNKEGFMSGIEILQYFGTEVMRRIYKPIWVNRTINQIKAEQPAIALITDVRFLDEVEAIKKIGKVIRLTRNTLNLSHASETSLDNYENFDLTIENQSITHEEYIKTIEKLYNTGVLLT
jgi:hypothetical protein